MRYTIHVLALLLLAGCGQSGKDAAPETLTVMVFNAWGAGGNSGDSFDDVVAAIRRVDPDIVGLLETRLEADPCTAEVCPPVGTSVAPDIASRLGFHVYDQRGDDGGLWANAILSRYPILSTFDSELGVTIDVQGRKLAFFNVHLTDFPYQPYQLLGVPYGSAPLLQTAQDASAAAANARGPVIERLLADVASADDVELVIVTGDFNEPSHRDWTARAAAIGRHPLEVEYPTVLRLENAGFRDAYRTVYPDEIEYPGFTWPANNTSADAEYHSDRIDYVMVRGAAATIESAAIVGEKSPEADIVVTPWISDHRAVLVTVIF